MDSLFRRFLSLLSLQKFPVRMAQGIGSETPIASALFEDFGAGRGQISQNSLYFSLLSGNWVRRPVRGTLGRQPASPVSVGHNPSSGKMPDVAVF